MKDSHKKDAELSNLNQRKILDLEKTSSIQKKIGELNERLAAIVENSSDAIIGKDLDGVITSWNKGAERIYGYKAEEVIGRPVSVLVPSGQTDEIPQILGKISRGENIEHYETMRVGKDGRQVCVSLTVSPIKNFEGEIIGASTIARDITRRKQMEEALRVHEKRLALALEASNDGVWDWDMNGETYLSPKYYEMTGYSPGEIIPDLDFYKRIIHPDDVQRVMKTMEEHLKGHTEQSIVEYRMITKSGACRHILGKGKVIERDENGNPLRIIGTISDITERKKAEEQIKLAKEEWEQTFDAIPDIIAVIDNQHVIRRANKALASRLGIDRDEIIGKSCYRTICSLGKPLSNCPGSLSVLNGKEQMEERFLETLKGHYLISCTPIYAFDGSITCFVEVCRDISEQKKMEEMLREAAITDTLTGLFNRRGFFTLAEQQISLAERNKRNMLLLFLDLNNMKSINDTFGHREGDQALIDTALILKKTFRASDIIARIGGDEFAVLLAERSEPDIEHVIFGHIQNNLKVHNEQGGRAYQLSLSTGTAYFDPERPCTVGDLLSIADAKMYEEKKRYAHGDKRGGK